MAKHDASAGPRSFVNKRKSKGSRKTGFSPVANIGARQAVQWLSACGCSNPDIEKRLGLNAKFVWTWAKRETSSEKGGRGPAAVISRAKARVLKRSIVKVRFMTSDKLRQKVKNPASGKAVSAQTIRRALHSVGAISVSVRKGQMLTQVQKDRRVAWCEFHSEAGTDFAKWTFSDEKWWRVGGVKGNERIWVCESDPDPDERYVATAAHPAKVMIWAAISYHGRSSIHFFDGTVASDEYMDCVKEAYIPCCFDPEYLAMSRTEKYEFQQDGARCHTSKKSLEWLRKKLPKNIELVGKDDWPSSSPDLSPIERLWAILQDKVVEERAYTQEKLIKVVEEWWWKIPQSTIQKLYDSMPTRLGKCIGANGGRFRL